LIILSICAVIIKKLISLNDRKLVVNNLIIKSVILSFYKISKVKNIYKCRKKIKAELTNKKIKKKINFLLKSSKI